MTIAITREVSSCFAQCELTHLERVPINVEIARTQHHNYVQTLASLGCQIIELPEEPDLPDSVFVEDTALILPELAVITRPGAESRRAETESITRALAPFRALVHITEPGTIDGGDVIILGKKIYIGLSTRTNTEAILQLQEFLDNYGYMVTSVELHDCLHLKSAVTRVNDQTLLINKNWVDFSHFKDSQMIEVDPLEPYAANCLPIGGAIIFPSSFPKTASKLEDHSFKVIPIDVSEIAKAEGAVTCCSLIIPDETGTG